MRVQIRPFNYEAADYDGYVELRNAVITDRPSSASYERRCDKEWPADFLRERLLALDDAGRVVGTADFSGMPWLNDPRKIHLTILVHPQARRLGIGGALFERMLAQLAPLKPASIESQAREDCLESIRFLEKRDFKQVGRQQSSELDSGGFDAGRFEGLMDAVTSSGLVITSLGSLLQSDPQILRKIYDLEADVMPDIPWHETFTPLPYEQWLKGYVDNPDLLADAYTVALDGEVPIGLSQLWGSEASDSILYTGLTAVRRPYRHRGLATAMKVRAMKVAKGRLGANGQSPKVVTENEENNPMLQINLRLGFQPVPAWLIFVREKPAPAGE